MRTHDTEIAQRIVELSATHFKWWAPWEDHIIWWARAVSGAAGIDETTAAYVAALSGARDHGEALAIVEREMATPGFWDDVWRAHHITRMHVGLTRRARRPTDSAPDTPVGTEP